MIYLQDRVDKVRIKTHTYNKFSVQIKYVSNSIAILYILKCGDISIINFKNILVIYLFI